MYWLICFYLLTFSFQVLFQLLVQDSLGVVLLGGLVTLGGTWDLVVVVIVVIVIVTYSLPWLGLACVAAGWDTVT